MYKYTKGSLIPIKTWFVNPSGSVWQLIQPFDHRAINAASWLCTQHRMASHCLLCSVASVRQRWRPLLVSYGPAYRSL